LCRGNKSVTKIAPRENKSVTKIAIAPRQNKFATTIKFVLSVASLRFIQSGNVIHKVKYKNNVVPINHDWALRKNNGLFSVSKLYETVEQWLGELVSKGYVQLIQEKMTLFEEHIGEYQIAKLEIDFGHHAVVLEPVGTRVARAYGRVYFFLRGEKAKGFMLILSQSDHGKNEWRVVNRMTRSDIRPVFNQPLFEEALEKWLNQML